MIRAYKKKDFDAITALWEEAFGDTKEDIRLCLMHLSNYLMVYEYGGAIYAMYMAIPITSGAKRGYYIYAVATAKCVQGQGLATKLLEDAKSRLVRENKDFLVLVPASASLFDFYKARGFTAGSNVGTLSCADCSDQAERMHISRLSPTQMYSKRNAHFADRPFAQWDENMLTVIDILYGGCFYELATKAGSAFCMAYECGGKLKVSEICTNGISVQTAVCALAAHFGLSDAEAVYADAKGTPFAMFYPAEYQDHYFNLALN